MVKRICLVTSAHISYNPRLVKEADALQSAGYRVRVVAVNVERDKCQYDWALMRERSWTLQTLNGRRDLEGGKWRWGRAACRQKLYASVRALWRVPGGLERAYCRYYPELTRLSTIEPFDLIIAHNLPALPVAFAAARRYGARLGFDAEDFHRGEFEDTAESASIRTLTAAIEAKYIPRCDHLTAASKGIAAAYSQTLGVREPLTILNAFSRTARAGRTPLEALTSERRGDGLSLYWYSQVIGPDRGLEDALRATAMLRPHVTLHVRGEWARGYQRFLMGLATRLGVSSHIHQLPPVYPEELIERAGRHDVGLALEIGHTPNRKVALTNKLLTYLVAGIALAASNIPSQREIMNEVCDAGFLFPPGSPDALAAGLKRWIDDPMALKRARDRSRFYGDSRFCWESESPKLLDAVRTLLK